MKLRDLTRDGLVPSESAGDKSMGAIAIVLVIQLL